MSFSRYIYFVILTTIFSQTSYAVCINQTHALSNIRQLTEVCVDTKAKTSTAAENVTTWFMEYEAMEKGDSLRNELLFSGYTRLFIDGELTELMASSVSNPNCMQCTQIIQGMYDEVVKDKARIQKNVLLLKRKPRKRTHLVRPKIGVNVRKNPLFTTKRKKYLSLPKNTPLYMADSIDTVNGERWGFFWFEVPNENYRDANGWVRMDLVERIR